MITLQFKPIPGSQVIISRRQGGTIADGFDEEHELIRLTDSAIEYVDEDVEYNTYYFYRIDFIYNGVRINGYPKGEQVTVNTGVGPSKIAVGDWACGYFGMVSIDEFLETDELISQIFGTTRNPSPLGSPTLYHKVAFDGHVFLLGNRALCSLAQYGNNESVRRQLYTRGAIYASDSYGFKQGINTKATVLNAAANRLQDARVEKDGLLYSVGVPHTWDTYEYQEAELMLGNTSQFTSLMTGRSLLQLAIRALGSTSSRSTMIMPTFSVPINANVTNIVMASTGSARVGSFNINGELSTATNTNISNSNNSDFTPFYRLNF